MEAFDRAVKISSKGQITLPKAVRELLGTDIVRVVVRDGHVHIVPVLDAGGYLAGYAEKTGYVPIGEAREIALRGRAEDNRGNH